MSKSDPTAAAPNTLFRIVAVMVLFLSITACGLQVLAALTALEHPDPAVPGPTLFIPPILTLIGGVALSCLLEGIARLVACQPAQPPDHTASQVNLMMTIAELQSSLPTLIAESLQKAVAETKPAATDNSDQTNLHLQQLIKLMEEIKELSMLDDSQRKTRRKQNTHRRKNTRLEEAQTLIEQNNWAQADALLHLMESLHPGDPDVLSVRNRLDDARLMHQSSDWDQLNRQVADLLALSQYPQAIEAIDLFLEKHPSHGECRQMGDRVRQEQQNHTDSASNHLYEQIKSAAEARQWRTALERIQEFLDQYPDHPRAEKIRKQIRVIQKNAEIEERHTRKSKLSN